MNAIAEYIGYFVMLLSTIAALCGCAWLVMHLVWRTYRGARKLDWILRAVRHYNKVEPAPYKDIEP